MHYAQGYTQTVPCYTGTGCGSGDVGTQPIVFGCCSMSNTLSYRPAIGADACLPCHGKLRSQNTHIPWVEKP